MWRRRPRAPLTACALCGFVLPLVAPMMGLGMVGFRFMDMSAFLLRCCRR